MPNFSRNNPAPALQGDDYLVAYDAAGYPELPRCAKEDREHSSAEHAKPKVTRPERAKRTSYPG
jgi:hypothetical protein